MLQMAAGKHWQPWLDIEGAIKEWLRRWCGYVREAPSRSSDRYLEQTGSPIW